MSKAFWVVVLAVILFSGISSAYTSHNIARGFVTPSAHNIVLAAGAGSGSASCIYLSNPGQSSFSMLFGDFDPNVGTNGVWINNGGGAGTVFAFPIDIPMRYAFDSNTARFRVYLTDSDCFTSNIKVSQYPNAWSSFTNGTAWASPYVNFGSFAGSSSPTQSFAFDTLDYSTMLTYYNNTGDMYLTTFASPDPNAEPVTTGCSGIYACALVNYYQLAGIQIGSSSGANPPNMTFILDDFVRASISSSSLGFGGSTYFNFQILSANTSSVGSQLKLDHNSLNVSAIGNIKMSYRSESKVIINITDNPASLCNVAYTAGNSFIMDTNVFAIGDNYIVCLNMSNYNGGRDFIGVIDIANVSAASIFGSGSIDSQVFLVSPKDKFFYNVSYSPIVPSTLADFQISVDFAYPMVGRLNYQRTIVNATQPWQNLTSSYGTHHVFTIPQGELNYTNVTINLFIEGVDSLSSTHVFIQQPAYSLFATNITPVFPGVVTSITPYDDIVNRISSGLNVLIDTAPCPICVPPQLHTSIQAICSVDNGTDRGTTLYAITPLNSTSPGHVFVAHWSLAEINGTGVHNISCRPTGSNVYYFQENTTTVNVTIDPTFFLVNFQNVPSCDVVTLGHSQSQCENLTSTFVQNLSYYGAWYCRQSGPLSYPDSYCQFWDGYGCTNASLVPSGYAVNGSTMNVNCVVLPSGNFTQPPANMTVPPILANNTVFSNFIYNYLGMSVYGFLSFISLIIAVILSILTAVKSRSGLATGVVFIGVVFVFAVVGWLPLWVMISLAVIVAFLVARFARETIMGGK